MKSDTTDKLFSRLIRLLADATCERCGKYHGMSSQGLHCAHYPTRAIKATRWFRDAARALCYGCHQYLDTHKEEKTEFFMEKVGQKRFNAMVALSQTHAKFTHDEIKAIRKDLREKIARLE